MYKIIFRKKASHFLHKLEFSIKKRIWDKLQVCKRDPFRFLEPLVRIQGFKLRVGDYRLIVDINSRLKTLNVLEVGHRKNIYD